MFLGILSNKVRFILSPMEISPENVEKVTLASCVLHYFLLKKSPSKQTPVGGFDSEDIESGQIIPECWRLNGVEERMHSVNAFGSNNHPKIVKKSIANILTPLGKFHGKENLFKKLTVMLVLI